MSWVRVFWKVYFIYSASTFGSLLDLSSSWSLPFSKHSSGTSRSQMGCTSHSEAIWQSELDIPQFAGILFMNNTTFSKIVCEKSVKNNTKSIRTTFTSFISILKEEIIYVIEEVILLLEFSSPTRNR
jgi:hypothetical protein